MSMIIVEDVSKRFGEHEVLKHVNLTFEKGKIYGLIGRNGSGKSVLLKCIAGLVLPSSGKIFVQGKQIGRDVDFAPGTGIAIEQPGLLMKKSAYENMKILSALSKKPDKLEICNLIRLVGLDPTERKAVKNYSMGMKQRLSIAMALLDNPEILLLDEPMSNLDSAGMTEMRALYRSLAQKGKTIVVATHMKEDVATLCDCVYRLVDGQIHQLSAEEIQ